MSVYRPKYRHPKTGELTESQIWWHEFTFAGKRIRESAKTTLKTMAQESEKRKRLELERALDGLGRFADGVGSTARGDSAGSLAEDRLGTVGAGQYFPCGETRGGGPGSEVAIPPN
ncbi:MAG: hypothetical protein ABSD27_03395 [Bryobacteraceae bacterium]|jgi:hypothetical protein